jgi:hypothetical protein
MQMVTRVAASRRPPLHYVGRADTHPAPRSGQVAAPSALPRCHRWSHREPGLRSVGWQPRDEDVDDRRGGEVGVERRGARVVAGRRLAGGQAGEGQERQAEGAGAWPSSSKSFDLPEYRKRTPTRKETPANVSQYVACSNTVRRAIRGKLKPPGQCADPWMKFGVMAELVREDRLQVPVRQPERSGRDAAR